MHKPLRSLIPHEEFDYQTLLSVLGDYKRPRDRITTLIRHGTIIRIKKGLYVFGVDERRGPISKEILANLIYGPSYISLEYALQHHGIIPERVETVTSVTVGRSRSFATPVGKFSYNTIPMPAFRTGADTVEIGQGRSYLMAIPEKALADKLRLDKVALRTLSDVRSYLFESLRVEPEFTMTMRADYLTDYAERYQSRKIRLLSTVVRRMQQARGGPAHA